MLCRAGAVFLVVSCLTSLCFGKSVESLADEIATVAPTPKPSGPDGPDADVPIKDALGERKVFHNLFQNCVGDVGDVNDERLFLKHLEECVFTRSRNKNGFGYAEAETSGGNKQSSTVAADDDDDDDDYSGDDSADSSATETVYDDSGRKFVHLYLPGIGDTFVRRSRQLHERHVTKPTKPTPTTKKTSTTKNDIIVGEDRKRMRAKGLWG